MEKVIGINEHKFEQLSTELVENITDNLMVRRIIKHFLTIEVKNNVQIQESLSNWSAKKNVKISEFDIAALFIIMTFWYKHCFPMLTVFVLPKSEFITEHQKKIDFLFIPK